ncbi:MAG: hypothetical protein JW768_06365 [Chitinispirillaceae bacterium]|nr:hypothetical protein [Chitinispirillaceae bacterium]
MTKSFVNARFALPSLYPVAFLVSAVLAFSPATRADPIPLERRVAWQPGIAVSVPAKPDTVDVMAYGAAGDSSADDAAAFTAAIAALPASGGVVAIPAGRFRISQSLTIDRGIVLCGAGYKQTRLYFEMSDATPCIDIITYQRSAWTDATAGYTKGSRQVQVADASSFSPGCFAEIQQENDSAVMYTDTAWKQDWSENSVGQIVVVEAVSGNMLTLNRPLYLDYRADLHPQIRKQGLVTFAGVENLFITKTVATADGATISLKNAAYCRVRAVESYHTRKAHITCNTVYACEFRDSYFHHAYDYGGDGHGYGVTLGLHVTDCCIENNIFRHLRHAMMVQVGASGNVFGYNYSVENVQGAGETNLNDGWTPCDISMHGHYPNNNLFEGNVVQEIDIADYWGPCGPGNTVFRTTVMAEGIDVLDHSHDQNLGANVLPARDYGILVDTGISGTLSHGNVINATVQWDQSISDHAFPPSYYLTSKPLFFGDLPWPIFGPDVAQQCTLPAQKRFQDSQYIAAAARPVHKAFFFDTMQPYAVYTILGQRIGMVTQRDVRKRNRIGLTRSGCYVVGSIKARERIAKKIAVVR